MTLKLSIPLTQRIPATSPKVLESPLATDESSTPTPSVALEVLPSTPKDSVISIISQNIDSIEIPEIDPELFVFEELDEAGNTVITELSFDPIDGEEEIIPPEVINSENSVVTVVRSSPSSLIQSSSFEIVPAPLREVLSEKLISKVQSRLKTADIPKDVHLEEKAQGSTGEKYGTYVV